MTDSQLKKLKAYADLALACISIVGAVLGGGYAVVQYIDNSKADRAKETLNFVERFDNEKMSASRNAIDIVLGEDEVKLVEALKKGNSTYLEHIKAIVKERSVSKEHPLSSDLNQIFEFYDQLQVCVASSLCDEEVSLRFFGKYAFDLVGVFYPYIQWEKSQSGDSSYGFGIENYFNAYKRSLKRR